MIGLLTKGTTALPKIKKIINALRSNIEFILIITTATLKEFSYKLNILQ